MSRAIDQNIDSSPLVHCQVSQLREIVDRLIRAGHADAAELLRQSFSFSRGRQDRDLQAIGRQFAGGAGPHATAGGSYDCYFLCCHSILRRAGKYTRVRL